MRLTSNDHQWTVGSWMDGHAGTQLNQALGALPKQAEITRWTAALHYRFLGDLGPQVVQGCPGWLFYRDGLRPQPGHTAVFAQRMALARHWIDVLERAGVRVVVSVVPDKSRIEAKHLCGLRMSPILERRFGEFQQALMAERVPVVDLRPALSALPQAFYRTDVHMAPDGAQAAAGRVAEIALPLLGGSGTQQFESRRGAALQPRMGDLIVLAGLEHVPDGWRPPIEHIVPERIEAVQAGGLLDEGPVAEVVLLGDSNGLRSEFAERLGRGLGRQIWNQSQDGGFFSGAMLSALARRSQWPSGIKVVVWQFSELSLSLPLSADEHRALAALR